MILRFAFPDLLPDPVSNEKVSSCAYTKVPIRLSNKKLAANLVILIFICKKQLNIIEVKYRNYF